MITLHIGQTKTLYIGKTQTWDLDLNITDDDVYYITFGSYKQEITKDDFISFLKGEIELKFKEIMKTCHISSIELNKKTKLDNLINLVNNGKRYPNSNYFFTPKGIVYSTFFNKVIEHKQKKDRDGYHRVDLMIGDEKKYGFQVHRGVAVLFLQLVEGSNIVNHIDGDKSNNSVSNLEWTTTAENNKHAIDTGLLVLKNGEENPSSKLTEENVRWIRKNFKSNCVQFGCKALGRKFGVSDKAIEKIIKNKSWKHVV